MKINIPSSIIDPTYRYTRDKIEVQIQNSNGGMTKLLNVDIISKQLNIESDELLSHLQKSAKTTVIKKNGHFLRKIESVENIEIMIEDYIKKYVICPRCSNPEFTIEVNKKLTSRTCKACGYKRTDI